MVNCIIAAQVRDDDHQEDAPQFIIPNKDFVHKLMNHKLFIIKPHYSALSNMSN